MNPPIVGYGVDRRVRKCTGQDTYNNKKRNNKKIRRVRTGCKKFGSRYARVSVGGSKHHPQASCFDRGSKDNKWTTSPTDSTIAPLPKPALTRASDPLASLAVLSFRAVVLFLRCEPAMKTFPYDASRSKSPKRYILVSEVQIQSSCEWLNLDRSSIPYNITADTGCATTVDDLYDIYIGCVLSL